MVADGVHQCKAQVLKIYFTSYPEILKESLEHTTFII